MTGNMWIHCPYCGEPQSEEWEIMNLLQNDVWSLNCRACKKSCVLILYDDVHGSVSARIKEKTEEAKE